MAYSVPPFVRICSALPRQQIIFLLTSAFKPSQRQFSIQPIKHDRPALPSSHRSPCFVLLARTAATLQQQQQQQRADRAQAAPVHSDSPTPACSAVPLSSSHSSHAGSAGPGPGANSTHSSSSTAGHELDSSRARKRPQHHPSSPLRPLRVCRSTRAPAKCAGQPSGRCRWPVGRKVQAAAAAAVPRTTARICPTVHTWLDLGAADQHPV
jgi:hypothetical protein